MEPAGESAAEAGEAAEASPPSGETPELVKTLMTMGIEKELAMQVNNRCTIFHSLHCVDMSYLTKQLRVST